MTAWVTIPGKRALNASDTAPRQTPSTAAVSVGPGGLANIRKEMTRPRTKPTRTAGIGKPQPVVPGSAHTAAAARTVTRNEMPVLVTTSSIVMYLTALRAYGDGAEYGSVWVGAPYP